MKLRLWNLRGFLGLILSVGLFYMPIACGDTPCDELLATRERLPCLQKVVEDSIDERANIATWQNNNGKKHFHTQFQAEPLLIIRPGSNPLANPAWMPFYQIPGGKVILEEVDSDATSYVPGNDETYIRVKRHGNGEATMMIQLWFRSPPDGTESFDLASGDFGLTSGDNATGTAPPDNGSTNYAVIIIPFGLAVVFHIAGWIITAIDIYDTYYYNNGEGSPPPILCRVISVALTCYLNVVVHIYIKRRLH